MLRPSLALVLLVGTALAACKSDPTPTRPGPKASPAAVASAKAGTPGPLASPASRVLVKGAAAPRALAGTVLVDASYIVAQGAGNVLTVGGQQIVGAGNLITNDGGSLITNDGGSIVAQGGGNIVAQGGGNLITNDGGSLITNDGGSLFANDGTTFVANGIVAQGGGNIVAQGGGNYHLAEAPAPGQELRAAGMVLSVVSLATHKYVPLGRNAAGAPVYSIYSDARGGYTIYPEVGEHEDVMVVASVPGSPDAHTAYNVLSAAQQADAIKLSRDTALVTGYLREAFATQIKRLALNTSPPGVARCTPTDAEKQLVGILGQDYIDKLHAASINNRAYALKEDALKRISLACADLLFAKITPEQLAAVVTVPLQTRKTGIPDEAKGLPSENALAALTQLVRDLAAKGAQKTAADFACGPAGFQAANLCAFRTAYKLDPIKLEGKHALSEYIVNQMLWVPDPATDDFIGDLLGLAGFSQPYRDEFRILGASTGVELLLANQFLDDASGIRQQIVDLVATAANGPYDASVPSPVPLPSGTCAPDTKSPVERMLH